MKPFLYVVWFRDTSMEPTDEDYEWPACISITAETEAHAQAWGDRLAMRYAERLSEVHFLWSEIDKDDNDPNWDGVGTVPQIAYGEDASDEVIGW